MPLIAPILDDRSFEDLFAELRNRIPVYNPAWTDHHDSDPGITLLQLFAYLGEGLQFLLFHEGRRHVVLERIGKELLRSFLALGGPICCRRGGRVDE